MPITIENLNLAQLQDEEIIKKILEKTQDYISYRKTHEAREMNKQLENQIGRTNLEETNPKIYAEYKSILAKLKFIAIDYLIEEEVLDLIKAGFLDGLKEEDIDVGERIKNYLFGLIAIAGWDDLRNKIIAVLKENKQRLGPKTIQEWLDDYVKTLEARKHSSIERAKYVSRLALPKEESQLLLGLLKFYDSMKISVPIPTIGISEESLRDYFGEIGYPLSEEGERVLTDYLKMGRGLPPKEELVPPLKKLAKGKKKEKPDIAALLTRTAARSKIERETEEAKLREISRKPEKPKKPGFFKRLFGKKPKPPEPKKKKEPKPEEIIPPKIEEAAQRLGKIPSIYKGKISPYERKREVGIPTFPAGLRPISPGLEKTKQEIKKLEKEGKEEKKKPQKVDIKGKYHIQTMKKDVEKAKQALPRPEPKVKNNIVDLSGK